MLVAEKAELRARTAVDIVGVRLKEIDYYSQQLSMLGTNAALIAGFAFGQLVWEKSFDNWSRDGYDSEIWWEHVDDTFRVRSDWSWVDWWIYVTHILHILFTCAAIVENLLVLQVSVVTLCLGNGLAVRGPPGSVDQAAPAMAKALNSNAHRFTSGTILFLMSITMYVLQVFTPFISVPAVFIIVYLWRQMHVAVSELGRLFHLKQARSPSDLHRISI